MTVVEKMECVICKATANCLNVMTNNNTNTLQIRDYIYELLESRELQFTTAHFLCFTCTALVNTLLYIKRHIVQNINKAIKEGPGEYVLYPFAKVFATFKAKLNTIHYEENYIRIAQPENCILPQREEPNLQENQYNNSSSYNSDNYNSPNTSDSHNEEEEEQEESLMVQEMFSEPYRELTEKQEMRERKKFAKGLASMKTSLEDREVLNIFKKKKHKGGKRNNGRNSRASLRSYSVSSYQGRSASAMSVTSAYSCQTAFGEENTDEDIMNKRNFYCDIGNCIETYNNLEDLTKHKTSIHNLLDKFWCEECCYNKKFTSREDLHCHVLQTHNKILSACFYCNQEFRYATAYYRHLYEHTIRSFPCNFCERVYVDRASCLSHVKKDHKGKKKKRIEEPRTKAICKFRNEKPASTTSQMQQEEQEQASFMPVIKIRLQNGEEDQTDSIDSVLPRNQEFDEPMDDFEVEEELEDEPMEESVIFGPERDSDAASVSSHEINPESVEIASNILNEIFDKAISDLTFEENTDKQQAVDEPGPEPVEEIIKVPEPIAIYHTEIIVCNPESDKIDDLNSNSELEEDNILIPLISSDLTQGKEKEKEVNAIQNLQLEEKTEKPEEINKSTSQENENVVVVSPTKQKESLKPKFNETVTLPRGLINEQRQEKRARLRTIGDFSRFTHGIVLKNKLKNEEKKAEAEKATTITTTTTASTKTTEERGAEAEAETERTSINTNITEQDYESLIKKLSVQEGLLEATQKTSYYPNLSDEEQETQLISSIKKPKTGGGGGATRKLIETEAGKIQPEKENSINKNGAAKETNNVHLELEFNTNEIEKTSTPNKEQQLSAENEEHMRKFIHGIRGIFQKNKLQDSSTTENESNLNSISGSKKRTRTSNSNQNSQSMNEDEEEGNSILISKKKMQTLNSNQHSQSLNEDEEEGNSILISKKRMQTLNYSNQDSQSLNEDEEEGNLISISNKRTQILNSNQNSQSMNNEDEEEGNSILISKKRIRTSNSSQNLQFEMNKDEEEGNSISITKKRTRTSNSKQNSQSIFNEDEEEANSISKKRTQTSNLNQNLQINEDEEEGNSISISKKSTRTSYYNQNSQSMNEEEEEGNLNLISKKRTRTSNSNQNSQSMVEEEEEGNSNLILKKRTRTSNSNQSSQSMNEEEEEGNSNLILKKRTRTSNSNQSSQSMNEEEEEGNSNLISKKRTRTSNYNQNLQFEMKEDEEGEGEIEEPPLKKSAISNKAMRKEYYEDEFEYIPKSINNEKKKRKSVSFAEVLATENVYEQVDVEIEGEYASEEDMFADYDEDDNEKDTSPTPEEAILDFNVNDEPNEKINENNFEPQPVEKEIQEIEIETSIMNKPRRSRSRTKKEAEQYSKDKDKDKKPGEEVRIENNTNNKYVNYEGNFPRVLLTRLPAEELEKYAYTPSLTPPLPPPSSRKHQRNVRGKGRPLKK